MMVRVLYSRRIQSGFARVAGGAGRRAEIWLGSVKKVFGSLFIYFPFISQLAKYFIAN